MATTNQQMANMITALQQTIVELTTEVGIVKTNLNTTAASLQALSGTSNTSWGNLSQRIDDIDTDIADLQTKTQGGNNGTRTFHWNLEHKGTLKDYAGDRKAYRPWAKKVAAFCNSKVDGFRKALLWAEKMQTPIVDNDLAATQWEHIVEANTKLFDLLSLIASGDALAKIETTPGESQGFEAWRRLARQFMPTSRLTRIDRLNNILHTEPCSNMREVLGKIESWEQQWSKYEGENNTTLDIDLKLGALLKMLPVKEKAAIQLRYVEDENKLTYDVLRRQVEHWLESLQQGPMPMDVSTLDPSKMNETELEEALDILRKGKGRDKGRGRDGTRSPGGPRDRSPSTKGVGKGDPARKIAGNCWNCGLPGHTSAACRKEKSAKGGGKGLKSLGQEEEEEDGDDDSLGMLSLKCLDLEDVEYELICDHRCLGGRPPPTDEASLPKHPVEENQLCVFDKCPDIMIEFDEELNPFSEIGSDDDDSEGEGDDEAVDDKSEMITAIEEQLKKVRAIGRAESAEQEWQVPRHTTRHQSSSSALIRGSRPMTEAYRNPFEAIADNGLVDSSADNSIDLIRKKVERIGKEFTTISSPSISPIPSATTTKAVQYSVGSPLEAPPGLHQKVKVTITGLNGEDVTIVGHQVVEKSELSVNIETIIRDMPMSVGSASSKDDGGEEVEDFDIDETIDCIDMCEYDVDPEDIPYDLAKAEKYSEGDLAFPTSIPTSLISMSRSRRKKEKKKHKAKFMLDQCENECCVKEAPTSTSPSSSSSTTTTVSCWSGISPLDVSALTSTLCEEPVSHVVLTDAEYPHQNLETRVWNLINNDGERCLGGCPPPTDEASVPKHLVGGEELTSSCIQRQHQYPQYEVVYDECYSIDHILLFEDVDQIGIGCSIASDADLIEILAIDLFDKANEQKPVAPMMKRLLKKEVEFNEKMRHHHVEEEEEDPPSISSTTSSWPSATKRLSSATRTSASRRSSRPSSAR